MNMTTALHRRAMSLVDDAAVMRRSGELVKAKAQMLEAFRLEAEAADSLWGAISSEPSRSVLYRSAASMALQCELYDEAEKLVYKALAGNPPASIADQLETLLEQASFHRHLSVRGVELSNTDVQVVLQGRGIGSGIAPTSEVIPRIENTSLLLVRTAERLQDREYRPAGRPAEEVRAIADSFMTLPRAASYAFSLRVGRERQMSFVDPSEGLLNEFLDCLELLEQGNEAALKARISDPAYYNNFIALAQTVSPDGERVQTVGFTVQRGTSTREVSLRQTPSRIREGFTPVLGETTKKVIKGAEKPVEVSGQLKLADSIHETHKIQIKPEKGPAVTVYVPDGMMNDIVKPLWDEWVTIDGLKMGRNITLMNIRRMQ